MRGCWRATLGNHIPGKPLVVVKNFTGAGSLRLARYLQDAAPRDGLSFGTFDTALLISPMLKDGINLDASKLSWIGTIAVDLQVCVLWNGSRAKSVGRPAQGATTVFGATGRDDIRYISTDVLRKVIGANIKIVPGYPGTADIRLALEKSEIDGECETYQSLKSTKPGLDQGAQGQHLHSIWRATRSRIAECPLARGLCPLADRSRGAQADLFVRRGWPALCRTARHPGGPA